MVVFKVQGVLRVLPSDGVAFSKKEDNPTTDADGGLLSLQYKVPRQGEGTLDLGEADRPRCRLMALSGLSSSLLRCPLVTRSGYSVILSLG